jgi:hypothetical protein
MEFKRTEFLMAKYSSDVVEQATKNLETRGFGGQKSNRKKSSSGQLSKGLGFKIKVQPNKLETSFTSKEAYGSVVEEGRRAGATPPPTAAIEKWIRTKPIKVRKTFVNSNGQKVSQFVERTDANIKSAAIAISKSIGKNGIKEVPFMSRAMQKAFDDLPMELALAIVEDMQDMIIDDFKKDKRYNIKKI